MTSGRPPRTIPPITHRLVEIPIRELPDGVAGGHRVMGSLTMSHGTGRAVVVAWVRARLGGPVQVLVGGVSVAHRNDEDAVDFPLGSRGRQLSPAEVDTALSALHWEPARLAVDAETAAGPSFSHRIEDIFLLDRAPLGFLAVATPMTSAQVGTVVEALSDELARLEALRSGRGVHRRQLARAERNLEYLDRSAGAGCWELSLWTGGVGIHGARAMAAIIAGSGDLAEVPLLVRPEGADAASQYTWSESAAVGTDAVAALARPPIRELPGVRVVQLPEFDQNVEDRVQVRMGSVIDGSRSGAAPFGVSLDSLNRHMLVTGATGSGKSESVRSLLIGLIDRGIPWLVIEPAKAEYGALASWLDPARPLAVIRPGDPTVPPPMVNPLEPSSLVVAGVTHTFPLQTHVDLVKALFVASFEADEPFPQVLSAGLVNAYRSRGWNLVTGSGADPSLSPPTWPVLGDLVRESLDVVGGLGYGAEVRDNVRGFIRVRLESLRSGTPGRFFEDGFPLDLADLLQRPAVFEIEDLGDDRDKAFFIGNLVIRLVELLRLRQRHGLQPPGLSHVLVIEEAHRLLRKVAEDSPSAHAVGLFANLLAEIRSYGEGLVIVEQIPTKVIPDVVKNSAIKVMHRLPGQDDRDVVGSTMNLTEAQSTHVVALAPGVAAAHVAGMDRPVLVQFDRVGTRPRTGATSVTPLVGARTAACPAECVGQHCTLGEIESSRDLATPAVQTWAEQVTIAHLTWDEVGTPTGSWLERLRAAEPRRARCAISLAASAAAGRRGGLIRSWHDPDAFVRHIAGVMSDQLATGRSIDRPGWKWSVGQFRFPAIRRALRDTAGTADRTQPHPGTAQWRGHGVDLPGPSWTDQLTQLDAFGRSLPPVRPAELAGSPPVLDELARALGYYDAAKRRRIAQAVGGLGLSYRWLAPRLGVDDD